MADNLRLAESVFEFHNFLVAEAKGQSLEPFYEKVPEALRGYVELNYDYYNRPLMRCLEGLLYESPYYKKSLQSLRIFKQTNDGARPFFQNTPRLKEENQIEWSVPFDSPLVDELFRIDDFPRPLGEIRELLGLSASDDLLLQSFVTREPAPPRERWESEAVRIRAFGHACALIEWKGNSVLVDPCISLSPSEGGMDRYTYRSLPEKIDYVLITHIHQDHFAIETLLRLRHKVGCLVVPRATGVFWGDISLKTLARKIGFKNVVEVDALESLELPGGEIIAVPFLGEHADLAHSKTGYLIRAGHEQILFGADSDCLDRRMYQHLRRILGPIQTDLSRPGMRRRSVDVVLRPVSPRSSRNSVSGYDPEDTTGAIQGGRWRYLRRSARSEFISTPWVWNHGWNIYWGWRIRKTLSRSKRRGSSLRWLPAGGLTMLTAFREAGNSSQNQPARECFSGIDARPAATGADQTEDQFTFA